MAKKRTTIKTSTPAVEARDTGGDQAPDSVAGIVFGMAELRPDAIDEARGMAASRNRVLIEIPVGPPNPKGYLPRKVETRLDSASDQPLTMRRIFEGMQAAHEQLESGKHVDTYPDAMRRLIELVGQQMALVEP